MVGDLVNACRIVVVFDGVSHDLRRHRLRVVAVARQRHFKGRGVARIVMQNHGPVERAAPRGDKGYHDVRGRARLHNQRIDVRVKEGKPRPGEFEVGNDQRCVSAVDHRQGLVGGQTQANLTKV